MTDKINLKNKQGLLEYFYNLKDDVCSSEMTLQILMDYYVYGGFDNFRAQNILADMTQKDIYWFVLEKAVEMVNKGGILSKWLIGKELIQYNGFLSQDKALGRFLIEFSAHEGYPDACDYMAEQYHHGGLGNKNIVFYWQNCRSNCEMANKVGQSLPLYINADDGETFDGSVWRTIRLRSE